MPASVNACAMASYDVDRAPEQAYCHGIALADDHVEDRASRRYAAAASEDDERTGLVNHIEPGPAALEA